MATCVTLATMVPTAMAVANTTRVAFGECGATNTGAGAFRDAHQPHHYQWEALGGVVWARLVVVGARVAGAAEVVVVVAARGTPR